LWGNPTKAHRRRAPNWEEVGKRWSSKRPNREAVNRDYGISPLRDHKKKGGRDSAYGHWRLGRKQISSCVIKSLGKSDKTEVLSNKIPWRWGSSRRKKNWKSS